jgi:hypothetical protein
LIADTWVVAHKQIRLSFVLAEKGGDSSGGYSRVGAD